MTDRDAEGAGEVDVAVVGPDGGETIELGAIRIRILEDGRLTGHRLGVAEITIPAHTPGPPQHRHSRHDESFHVVSGTARFFVGDRTYDAPAGTFVMVPPGAPHGFGNASDGAAVLLNTFTPDLYVDYFRELGAASAQGRALTPELMTEIMGRYATSHG
jgi:quercetin dioxygenase-like cupin family protein